MAQSVSGLFAEIATLNNEFKEIKAFINGREQSRLANSPARATSISVHNDNNYKKHESVEVESKDQNSNIKEGLTLPNCNKSERGIEQEHSQSYDDAKSFKFSLVGDVLSSSAEVRNNEVPEYRFDRDTILKDFIQDHEDLDFVVISPNNKEKLKANNISADDIVQGSQNISDTQEQTDLLL